MTDQLGDGSSALPASDPDDGVAELEDGFLLDPGSHGATPTAEVLAKLKERALQRSKTGGKPENAVPPTNELAQRRRSTLEFFLDQRRAEFEAHARALAADQEKLEEARGALQRQSIDDLVDFLSLMSGGAETPEAREVLGRHGGLLANLGVTVDELVRRVRQRR